MPERRASRLWSAAAGVNGAFKHARDAVQDRAPRLLSQSGKQRLNVWSSSGHAAALSPAPEWSSHNRRGIRYHWRTGSRRCDAKERPRIPQACSRSATFSCSNATYSGEWQSVCDRLGSKGTCRPQFLCQFRFEASGRAEPEPPAFAFLIIEQRCLWRRREMPPPSERVLLRPTKPRYRFDRRRFSHRDSFYRQIT